MAYSSCHLACTLVTALALKLVQCVVSALTAVCMCRLNSKQSPYRWWQPWPYSWYSVWCLHWQLCVQVELWRVHTDGDSPGLTADTVCGQATQPRVLQTLITYRRIWSKEAAKSKSVGHWGNCSPLVYHFLTMERSIWLYSRTGRVQGTVLTDSLD